MQSAHVIRTGDKQPRFSPVNTDQVAADKFRAPVWRGTQAQAQRKTPGAVHRAFSQTTIDSKGNPEEDFPNLVKYADPVARVSR